LPLTWKWALTAWIIAITAVVIYTAVK
jgi:hypothetical protein